MLSRCCSIEQLHIVDMLDPEKISVNESVKEEAEGVHNTLYVIFSFQELGMLELVAKSFTRDNPMDSVQVGKAVFS